MTVNGPILFFFFLSYGLFILLAHSISLSTSVDPLEFAVLEEFYNATGGPEWSLPSNPWLIGDPCEEAWYGVLCSQDLTQVVSIMLPSVNLAGTLPPSIGNLTHLTVLSLHSNRLLGTIPTEIDQLTLLVLLELNSNQFTGSIPSLSNLKSLKSLNLGNQSLEGEISPELTSLPLLTLLFLENNKLSGSIPTIDSPLERLTLQGNKLTSWADGFNLEFNQSLVAIDVSTNLIAGSFPLFLLDLKSLQELNFSKNFLNGTIPTAIGDLTSLQKLDLSYNKLRGSIPSFARLSSLQQLDLRNNQLQGSIILPPQQLQSCDLSSNLFCVTYDVQKYQNCLLSCGSPQPPLVESLWWIGLIVIVIIILFAVGVAVYMRKRTYQAIK